MLYTRGMTEQLPPLTPAQKFKYFFILIVILAGIGLVVWNVAASNKEDSKANDLKTTGQRATGTATGEAHTYTDRSKRGGTSERYKAIYSYTYKDQARDNREIETTAIGEKIYDTKDEVQAIKGTTVDIYYDPADATKGTYVDDNK